MYGNTTGDLNTAAGYAALSGNTTADNNTAFGGYALQVNTTGTANVAVGTYALDANTTASNNTAVGYAALTANTEGTLNVALGTEAGSGVTSGGGNTLIGYQAGVHDVALTTGANNVVIGVYSNTSAVDSAKAIVIGYNVTGESDYTTIGSSAGESRLAHGSTTWATVSDQRYKKDIVDSTAGLNFINALQPRTFKYKTLGELPETFRAYEEGSTEVFKNTQTNHGFIAQEVKAAIDADDSIKDGFKLWDDRDDGSQEVAEAALIPVLVKAIQELSEQNAALTARIEELES
jgi:trimeric autotransporter adhesin